jgi:hypothetical protein
MSRLGRIMEREPRPSCLGIESDADIPQSVALRERHTLPVRLQEEYSSDLKEYR